jgi:hypothetical protein
MLRADMKNEIVNDAILNNWIEDFQFIQLDDTNTTELSDFGNILVTFKVNNGDEDILIDISGIKQSKKIEEKEVEEEQYIDEEDIKEDNENEEDDYDTV